MEEFSDVRFKQRAVIEFLTAGNVSQIEIHRRMEAVCGDQCVDVSTVRRCVMRFKDGELGQAGFKNKTPIFFFFKDGFQKLAPCWRKCIEVGSDFVEK